MKNSRFRKSPDTVSLNVLFYTYLLVDNDQSSPFLPPGNSSEGYENGQASGIRNQIRSDPDIFLPDPHKKDRI